MNQRFKSICYVHGPSVGMIVLMLWGAVIEAFACLMLGLDHPLSMIFGSAALTFLFAAAGFAYAIWAQERIWANR